MASKTVQPALFLNPMLYQNMFKVKEAAEFVQVCFESCISNFLAGMKITIWNHATTFPCSCPHI